MPTNSSAMDTEADSSQLPRIASIFVIRFDQRVGYTIAWERSKPGLVLSGAVEYKSLPSGLHNVQEDLIYYVHESYAGISAFQSAEASEAERSARFVSVGVLVPRGRGRFGGGWLHAEKLKEFATALLVKQDDFGDVEEWWEQYRISSAETDATSSREPTEEDQNDRSEDEDDDVAVADMSESTVLVAPGPEAELPPSHPILSTINLLDVLGPLIFPIYRASLLRKRILFISNPPLLPSCNFVYNLSLLTSIPADLASSLPDSISQRPNPLFSIGVHDIPLLDQLSHSSDPSLKSWIACTSDTLFTTKTSLSDIRVTLPSAALHPTSTHPKTISAPNWPTVSSTSATTGVTQVVKATQRDLRRYHALRAGLTHLHDRQFTRRSLSYASLHPPPPQPTTQTHPSTTTQNHATTTNTTSGGDISKPKSAEPEDTTETAPWAAVLYDSFMWWASAGARGAADLDAEHEQDREGLAAAAEVWDAFSSTSCTTTTGVAGREGVAVVAYFQRMTTLLLTGLGDLLEDDEDERDGDGEDDDDGGDNNDDERRPLTTSARQNQQAQKPTTLDTEDLANLGLDAWSSADREFIAELGKLYFEKEVMVKGASVEWCGVRVC